MELRQLEYFVYVAEEGSFTRAAAKAHVAQPGVSAQIQRLEREVGEALFDRTHRSVRLTDAGSALLPYARTALDAVDAGRLAVDELRGLVRGQVRVGMMAALPSLDVVNLLASFRDHFPAVSVTVTEASSRQLLKQLLGGDLDAAIVGLPEQPPTAIQVHPICVEPLVVACRHGGPLATERSITLDELRERTFISLPQGSGLRAFLLEACLRAGFEPEITIEVSDPQLLVALTARGLGLSLLPRSVAVAHPDQLHVLNVTQPRLEGRIALAWRAAGPRGPAARQFLRHAKRTLAGADRSPPPDPS